MARKHSINALSWDLVRKNNPKPLLKPSPIDFAVPTQQPEPFRNCACKDCVISTILVDSSIYDRTQHLPLCRPAVVSTFSVYHLFQQKLSHTKDFQIAIIGGGIAGVCLAIALNNRSIHVTLYEQAPAFGEIGAGVSFSPNAVQAMSACHRGIYEAFERVCTRNLWPSKQKVWSDYLDGYSKSSQGTGRQDAAFTISNGLGQNGDHCASFLAELVKLLPEEIASFGKRLENIPSPFTSACIRRLALTRNFVERLERSDTIE